MGRESHNAGFCCERTDGCFVMRRWLVRSSLVERLNDCDADATRIADRAVGGQHVDVRLSHLLGLHEAARSDGQRCRVRCDNEVACGRAGCRARDAQLDRHRRTNDNGLRGTANCVASDAIALAQALGIDGVLSLQATSDIVVMACLKRCI